MCVWWGGGISEIGLRVITPLTEYEITCLIKIIIFTGGFLFLDIYTIHVLFSETVNKLWTNL